MIQTDLLTQNFLKLVKFAPPCYLLFASLSLAYASGMWHDNETYLKSESDLPETFYFSRLSKACFLTGIVLLAALLILELIIRRYFRKHYEKLIGEETQTKTFFEQLSTIE